ncbi:MAG: ParB/RepB/Spo0J family partition protein [Clostridia bacterium]|nr:ParB/RepB/Spo0J family partition protein [Clostridia bacterium]
MINIQNLKLNNLVPFEGSPFEFREDEGFLQLYDSISENGVISPIVVCERNGQYEIVSGYRRAEACKRLNIDVIPAIIKELSREQAIVMHVDSNLQRDKILPSEKAFGYKMRLDAIKKQGSRSDLTSNQAGRKLESADIIANETDDSKTQVRRYIRLTFLIPEILKLVDEERIAFTPAVALSYLSPEEQHMVHKFYEEVEATPSYSQAVELKNLSAEGKLNEGTITEIMSREKPNQIEYFKMPFEHLKKVAPKIRDKDFEKFVIKACEYYYKVLQRQKDRDSR